MLTKNDLKLLGELIDEKLDKKLMPIIIRLTAIEKNRKHLS